MANTTDFQIGDVVQLRSGGPRMTIALRHNDGRWIVQYWNEAANKFALETLHAEVLRRAD